MKLEQEAKEFAKKKSTPKRRKSAKPMDARKYFAGFALSGLLAGGVPKGTHIAEVKREAYRIADIMLDDE